MHPRVEEFVREAEARYGLDVDVREFADGTETAAAAARAVGCDVEQIASSLVFEADGDLVVVITSGANRVSEAKLAAHFGVDPSAVSMAAPDRIRETVGWSIGGVPPLCHETPLPTVFDETLLSYDVVWGACGTPASMFPVDPSDSVTSGTPRSPT